MIACRLELQNLQLTHRAQRAESELTDLQAFLSQLLAAAAPAASSSLPLSEPSLPELQSRGMTDLLAETSSPVTSAVTPMLTGHSAPFPDCSPLLPVTSPGLPIGSLPLPIGPPSLPSGSSSQPLASPIPPIGPLSLPVSSLSVPIGPAYVSPAAHDILLPVGAIRTASAWFPASSSPPSPVSCRQLPTDAQTCTHMGAEPGLHAAMSTYSASGSQADIGLGTSTMTDSHKSACVALLPATQRQSTVIGLSAPVTNDGLSAPVSKLNPQAERQQQSPGLLSNSTSVVSPDMPSCHNEQQAASSAQKCSGNQFSTGQPTDQPELQTEQPEAPTQHHDALIPQISTPNQQRLAEGMAAAVLQHPSEEMWASLPVQSAATAQALDSSRGQSAVSSSFSGLTTVAAAITSRQKCSLAAAGVSSHNTFSPKASGQLGTVLPLRIPARDAGPVSNSKQLACADSTERAQHSPCPVPKDSPTLLCTSPDCLGPAGSPGGLCNSRRAALSSGPVDSARDATIPRSATTPGLSASSPGPASSSPAPASPHNAPDNSAISSHGQIPNKSKPRQDTIASSQQPGDAGPLCSSGSRLGASVQMCEPAGWSSSSNSQLPLAGRLKTMREAEQRTMLRAGQTPPDSTSGDVAGISVQSVHTPQDSDPAAPGASDTLSPAAQESGTDAHTSRTDKPVSPCMDIAKQRLLTDRHTVLSRDVGRQDLNSDSSPNQEKLPESNVIDSQVNHSAVDLFCMVSDKGSQGTASPCYALHQNSPNVTADHCAQPNLLTQHETADASQLNLAATSSVTSTVHLRSGQSGIALTNAPAGQIQTSAQLESAGMDLALMDPVCILPTATAYPDSADTDQGLQEALDTSHTAWQQPSDALLSLTGGLRSPSPAIVQRQSADTDLAAASAGGAAQIESTVMQDEGNLLAAMSLREGESAEKTASLRRLSAGTERRVHVSERLRQMFNESPIMSGHNSEVSI